METASDPDAILIAMEQGFYNKAEYNSGDCIDPTTRTAGAAATCATTASTTARARPSPDSVEYGYFDLLHKQIESDYCVDTDRQFYAGYSSGGWMAHQLGCQFPDVLRAQGERHRRAAARDPQRRQDLRRPPDRGVPDPRLGRPVEPVLGLGRGAGTAAAR